MCVCVRGGGMWRWWRGTEVDDSKYSTCMLHADAQFSKIKCYLEGRKVVTR